MKSKDLELDLSGFHSFYNSVFDFFTQNAVAISAKPSPSAFVFFRAMFPEKNSKQILQSCFVQIVPLFVEKS